jgi:hypothetical protein
MQPLPTRNPRGIKSKSGKEKDYKVKKTEMQPVNREKARKN